MNFHCLRNGHTPATPRSSGPVECVRTKNQENQARIQRERAAHEAYRKRALIMMRFREPAALTHIDFEMNFGSRKQNSCTQFRVSTERNQTGSDCADLQPAENIEEEEPPQGSGMWSVWWRMCILAHRFVRENQSSSLNGKAQRQGKRHGTCGEFCPQVLIQTS